MSTVARALTYDDLCRQREDGNRYELIGGTLVSVASPSPWHQRLLLQLAWAWNEGIADRGLGEAFVAPLDVRFSDQTVVQPDLVVVLADRASIVQSSLIEGAPSLVAEVESRSSRAIDRRTKAAVYARHGVPEYWLLTRSPLDVVAHADPSPEGYRTIRREEALLHASTIPGLTVNLTDLFAAFPAGD